MDDDWDWLTDDTINDAPSVEYNQVLNESETESASDICSSQVSAVGEQGCVDFHDNQLGYLKCSLCNPTDYTNWEEW